MILTSYIFRQTSRSVFISTCVFLGVIWLSQSFKSIKLIIEKGSDLTDFFILSAFSLPSWLLIALPLGTFAGCMISYIRLQNDKEIIVMKSAGLSPLKISKPALLVALICSLILFIISHFILPETYKNFKKLQNEIRNSNQEFILKDNIFIDINKTQTIFIGKLKNSNDLEEIFIQDRTDNLYLVEYFSKRGNLNIGEAINLMMIEGTRISTLRRVRNDDNWSLVAIESGRIGYVQTQFIKPGQGGAIPDGPVTPVPTNNDIEIYSPEGIEENSTFQLNATGLQIIKGRFNQDKIKNVESVTFNKEEAKFKSNLAKFSIQYCPVVVVVTYEFVTIITSFFQISNKYVPRPHSILL